MGVYESIDAPVKIDRFYAANDGHPWGNFKRSGFKNQNTCVVFVRLCDKENRIL